MLYEICTLPTLCGPGVLVGCRRVAKTVLLHGPAGTGKTYVRARVGHTLARARSYSYTACARQVPCAGDRE